MKFFRRRPESAEIGSVKRDLDCSMTRLDTATRRFSQAVEKNSREKKAKEMSAQIDRFRRFGAAE